MKIFAIQNTNQALNSRQTFNTQNVSMTNPTGFKNLTPLAKDTVSFGSKRDNLQTPYGTIVVAGERRILNATGYQGEMHDLNGYNVTDIQVGDDAKVIGSISGASIKAGNGLTGNNIICHLPKGSITAGDQASLTLVKAGVIQAGDGADFRQVTALNKLVVGKDATLSSVALSPNWDSRRVVPEEIRPTGTVGENVIIGANNVFVKSADLTLGSVKKQEGHVCLFPDSRLFLTSDSLPTGGLRVSLMELRRDNKHLKLSIIILPEEADTGKQWVKLFEYMDSLKGSKPFKTLAEALQHVQIKLGKRVLRLSKDADRALLEVLCGLAK